MCTPRISFLALTLSVCHKMLYFSSVQPTDGGSVPTSQSRSRLLRPFTVPHPHKTTGSQLFFFLLSGLSHLRKKRTELVFNRRLLRKSSVQCFHVNLPNRLCDQENGQNDHVSHSFIWPSRPVCNRPEYRFNLCRLLNSLKTTDTCPRVRVPTHWWLLLVLGDLAWHLWDHTVLMLT